jgi:peroxiredoxin
MAQLRQNYEKFKALGAEVIVVGPDHQVEFADYWSEHNLPFPGIPDPAHKVLDRYGQQFNLLRLGRMPAQAVIDAQGTLRFIYYGSSMMDIPDIDEMLDIISQLQLEAAGEGRD